MNNQRLELVADFYEYTMANGYFNKNMEDRIAYFDVFFRKVPDEGGYAIVAGLEQIINYIRNLSFDEEDISYLRKQNKFSEEFLNYLENFRFTGDIERLYGLKQLFEVGIPAKIRDSSKVKSLGFLLK